MDWAEIVSKQGENFDSELEQKILRTLDKHSHSCRIAYPNAGRAGLPANHPLLVVDHVSLDEELGSMYSNAAGGSPHANALFAHERHFLLLASVHTEVRFQSEFEGKL